jgi:hypothetical protein
MMERNELFGMEAGASVERVLDACLPLMNAAGLRFVLFHQYESVCRELARLLRTRQGPELRAQVRVMVRKWTGLGLDRGLLQAMVQAGLVRFASGRVEVDDEYESSPGAGAVASDRVAAGANRGSGRGPAHGRVESPGRNPGSGLPDGLPDGGADDAVDCRAGDWADGSGHCRPESRVDDGQDCAEDDPAQSPAHCRADGSAGGSAGGPGDNAGGDPGSGLGVVEEQALWGR